MDNKTSTTQNSSVDVFGMSLLKRYFATNIYRNGFFYWRKTEVNLQADAFARMQRLRLLQLDYVNLTGDFKEFPKRLRWLRWHGFPLKSIPNNLCLEDLVDLDMRNSNLEQLWKGTKVWYNKFPLLGFLG